MTREFVRKNVPLVSLIIYIILYGILIFSRPHLIYNKNGTIRNFGIGYSTRSILPIWLLAIIIAIMSYFAVLYYVSYPYLHF